MPQLSGELTSLMGMIGLLFFLIFFVVAVLWVYRPGAKKTYQDYSKIPFEESDK